MSRKSDAKKARRRKRRTGRDARWIPESVIDALVEANDQSEAHPRDVAETILGVGYSPDHEWSQDVLELVAAAEKFGEWLTLRGWTFDAEFSLQGLASWCYESSLSEFEDDSCEPVTRIWFTVGDRDEDFPESVSAALVGTSGEDDGALYTVGVDRLIEGIAGLEAYRAGDPIPVL